MHVCGGWRETGVLSTHGAGCHKAGGSSVFAAAPQKSDVSGEEETWHVEWGAGFVHGSDDINANGPSDNGPSDDNSLNWRGARQEAGERGAEPRKKGLLFIFWMGKVAHNVFCFVFFYMERDVFH